MIQMLKMLERFPIGDASQGYGFGSVKTVNVMADAMRLAFADRSIWMGDADFVPVPGKGLLERRPTSACAARRSCPARASTRTRCRAIRARMKWPASRPARAWRWPSPSPAPARRPRTSRWWTSWGNMVTYTNTIESSHGIGVFAGYKNDDGIFKNHGFLLNNELTDFNTTPTTNPYTGGAGYNDVQPNKRPRSSMAPTMIFTPRRRAADRLRLAGRLDHHQLGAQRDAEPHRPQDDAAGGDRRAAPVGHKRRQRIAATTVGAGIPAVHNRPVCARSATRWARPVDIGSVQAVLVDPHTGKQYGAADSRREGTVIGLPR